MYEIQNAIGNLIRLSNDSMRFNKFRDAMHELNEKAAQGDLQASALIHRLLDFSELVNKVTA